jgi:predicted ArsR family transcriptional regulator
MKLNGNQKVLIAVADMTTVKDGVTTMDIAKKLRCSRAAAYSRVAFLLVRGLLQTVGAARQGRRGSPAAVFALTKLGRRTLNRFA